MQRFINWVLAIGALVGMFYGIGLIVPRTTTRKAQAQYEAAPEKLYALVADVTTWPSWHPDVSDVRPLESPKDKPVYEVTFKDGRSFRMEVVGFERDKTWAATYELGGTSSRMNVVFGWVGEKGRAYMTRTSDTRDPWRRARLFLWDREQSKPTAILDALAVRLGESVQATD